MTKNAPVTDISAYAVFKDFFWLGGMARTAMGRFIPTGKAEVVSVSWLELT